jgi:hypothetical protein
MLRNMVFSPQSAVSEVNSATSFRNLHEMPQQCGKQCGLKHFTDLAEDRRVMMSGVYHLRKGAQGHKPPRGMARSSSCEAPACIVFLSCNALRVLA